MKGIETVVMTPPTPRPGAGSDHCPAMKGIETGSRLRPRPPYGGSDHCPAMKGIETYPVLVQHDLTPFRSDHCPAMKGIETPLVRM